MKINKHGCIVGIILSMLFLPVIGTFIYSVSSKWTNTLIPEGFTFNWYLEIFKNDIFLESVSRSFLICLISLVFIALIMVPAVFIATYYFPKLEKIMELLVLSCFAIPGAVSVVGLLKLYSSEHFRLVGTIYILVGVYFVLAYPFVFRGIKNSLNGLNLRELIESANILGATTSQAFFKIIIPNISKGLTVSMLLTFSILFGEFLLVNMLVGGRFQTVQMYINSVKSGYSGHFSSALVITYFMILLITTGLAFFISREREK